MYTTYAYAVAFCAAGVALLWWKQRRPHRYPPGPPILPIVGSLPFMRDFGKRLLHEIFDQLTSRYGNIFSFAIGHRKIVVIGGYENVKEALVNQSVAFAGRPPHQFRSSMRHNPHELGISDSTNTPEWKAQRNVVMTLLRSVGYGQNTTEENILAECQHLIKKMASFEGNKFNPFPCLHFSVTNIICVLLFDRRFDYDDEKSQHILYVLEHLLQENLKHGELNFIPILRLLPESRKYLKNMQKLCDDLVNFLDTEIENRRSKMTHDDQPNDFIEAYLKEASKIGSGKTRISQDWSRYIALDFFIAGSDTSSITLSWSILYMISFPDVQQRVYDEIKRVVGEKQNGKQVRLSDRRSLPYTEATIMEVQRMACIAPFTLPHATTCDVEIAGYYIPVGTQVFCDLRTVSRDPKVWKNPDDFDPQRFLDDDGICVRPEFWTPFSLGRRMCLGEQLARQELFLFFTSMMQTYHFSVPQHATKPTLTPTKESPVLKPVPYEVCLEAR